VIGEEFVGMLKLYLNERVRSGEKLEFDTSLFIKEGAGSINPASTAFP